MATLPELPENQYHVPEPRFAELEKRVERFTRRAAKLGQATLSIEVVGEDTVPVLDDDGRPTGRVRVYKVVEVQGEAPTVAGFTFVARIEHTSAGNLIAKAPGCEDVIVPTHIRDGKPTCDHCKTRRARKDTFILMGEDGILIRVGRNCLADFLRSNDAAEALRIWDLLQKVIIASRCEDEDGCFGFGGGFNHPGTIFYVACVIRSIALHGWTSRKQAYENETMSTATDASFSCAPRPTDSKAAKEWDKSQPTDADREEAVKAVAWAKSLQDDSDYLHNLKVACSLEYVVEKHKGIVASVVMTHRRQVERDLEKAREAERTGDSKHFGTVGSRYVRELTVTKSNSWENEYGVTVLYVMEDSDGNVFKWFSSNGCWADFGEGRRELKVGDTFHFTFAVKSHGEYQERDETTITRAVPSADKPTHKWVSDATGEVFKTRKAMKAAEAA